MKITESNRKPVLVPCSLENFEYQIDPYIGCEHYCKYCYVLCQAETDWTKEIIINKDIIAKLSEELESIKPQKIYMGYYTDPYQPCEKQYRQTRQILELLAAKGFSASILTKSDLVVRDIDILAKMDDASISVSVAFNDNTIRRYFEINTINTEDRIEALKTLKKAGIKTSALLCPVIPFITEVKPLIKELVSCTEKIWIYGISILDRSDLNWKNVDTILKEHFSELSEKIEEVIFDKEHSYWKELRQELSALQSSVGGKLNIHV